jgi:hypothetical protein
MDLAHALGMPKSTLWDLKQDKDDPVIIACTSAPKPLLTPQHWWRNAKKKWCACAWILLVEECEDKMVRMRLEHKANTKRLKKNHRTALGEGIKELANALSSHAQTMAAKDDDKKRLTNEHRAEIHWQP